MYSKLKAPVIFIIGFYLWWTARVYLLSPALDSLGRDTFLFALVNLGCRLLMWVLPVYLYLKFYDKVNPWQYLKLNKNVLKGILSGLVVGFFYIIFYFLTTPTGPKFNLDGVDANAIIVSILTVGFIEETMFRGFILQKLAEVFNFHVANIITAILFLLIHFPGWIYMGTFQKWGIVTMIAIMVLGLICGYLLKYTKSLWGSMILHMINNLCSVVIFRA
jgi:membrane protease YdiL (CAAX protease family)